MTASRDALQRARRALRPPEHAYQRLLERRDRKRRRNQIAAGVLGLAIASGGLLAAVEALTIAREQTGPASSCVAIPPDLTHWWPGNGSGADTVGTRPATLHGDVTFGPGLVGQAFMLDGAGDFVSVPDDPSIDLGTGHFTVALWVSFDSTEGEQILVEKWVQRSFEPEIVTGWTFTKLADNHIGFGTVGGFSVDSGILDIPLGTWVHFAARRSGDRFQLFMNGERIASNMARNEASLDLDSPSSLKFGHRGGPGDTPGLISHQRSFLNGQIDEVKLVVGRALSNREIRAIVEAGARGRQC